MDGITSRAGVAPLPTAEQPAAEKPPISRRFGSAAEQPPVWIAGWPPIYLNPPVSRRRIGARCRSPILEALTLSAKFVCVDG